MSVNPGDWNVDFAFPNFNLALFYYENEAVVETES